MSENIVKDLGARLSVSKVKTFDDCQKKFHFSYIQKLPKKDYDFHIYGKFVHRILELFHLHYINGGVGEFNEVMTKVYKEAYKEYKSKLNEEQKKEAFESISAYLIKISSEPLDQRPNIIAAEKDFGINIDDTVLLTGCIDRVQIDPDGVFHVCDYKTTKNKKYLKNDWFQLMTYAYVLHLEDPSIEKVRASYILIRHKFEYITTEFNLKDILSIQKKFVDYAASIREEKLWRPNPNFLCSFCDFTNDCVEGKLYVDRLKPGTAHGEIKW